MKKNLVSVLLTGIFFAMLCSCSPSATTPPPTAYYLINASPDSDSLDFFLDGAPVKSNLGYGQDSGYFSTSPGLHDMQFRKAGTQNILINVNISLTAGEPYSIFAIDLLNKLRPAAVSDTASAPLLDTAKLRFLNFCVGSSALNAEFKNATDSLEYSSRSFNDQGSSAANTLFQKIKAGTYELNLINPVDSLTLISFPNITFSAGKIYTLYLKGVYNDTSAYPISEGIIQHN
jgi:hypothetical protein